MNYEGTTLQTEKALQHRVTVVTGSSSGIGFETSLLFARNKFHTYATMRGLQKVNELRKPTEGEKLPVEIIQLNVINEGSASNAVELVLAEKGKIDVLIDNDGYGLGGSFEDLSIDEMTKQFETNFYGLI